TETNYYEFYYSTPDASVLIWDRAVLLSVDDSSILSNINIIIDPNQGSTIEGYVFLEDNTPVEGVDVYAWSDSLEIGNGAVTDADGYYKIWGLEEVSAANAVELGYIVDIYSQNHPYQAYEHSDTYDNATWIGTGSTGINFLLKNSASISGTILDENGNPAANVWIDAWSYSSPGYGYAESDSSGNYAIAGLLPASDYIVSASSPDYQTQYFNGKVDEGAADFVNLTKGDAVNINFGLKQGGSIFGIVYLPDGNPAVDVWVDAWSETTYTGNGASTDNNGFYEITGLNPDVNDYILSAWADAYPQAYYNTPVAPSESSRNINLTDGFSISGNVTSNGSPVSGIWVEAWAGDSGGWGSTITQGTITNGSNFMISGLSSGTYELSIYSMDYTEQVYPDPVPVSADVSGFNFVLEKAYSIAGNININNLPDGQMLWVNAWSPSIDSGNYAEITGTSSTVTYQISGLSPAPDYIVDIYSEGYPSIVYDGKNNWDAPDLVDLSQGNQTGINFDLPSFDSFAAISGTVTFPAEAQPGEYAWIEAFSMLTGVGNGVSIELGTTSPVSYKINGLIKAEDYIVSIWSDKYKGQYFQGAAVQEDATPVNTNDSLPDNAVNFTLETGAVISGTVYLVKDNIPQPMPGVEVDAWSESTGSWGYAYTLDNGAYTIEGLEQADDFTVTIWHPVYGVFFYNNIQTVRDESSATLLDTNIPNTDIDFNLTEGKSIAGKVSNQNGRGLPDVWVDAWSDQQMAGNGTYTDGDGIYIIGGLPEGQYEVSAWPDWEMSYLPQTKNNIAGGTTGVDFKLASQAEFNVVQGLVTNSSAVPVPDAVIEIWSETEDFNGFGYGWTITDDMGTYKISGLSDGNDYVLMAWPPENSSFGFTSQNIIIDSDKTINITLEQAQSIKGTIYKKDGVTPVSGVWVYAYSDLNYFWGEAVSSKNGSYEIKQVPSGSDYVVTAVVSGFLENEKTGQSSEATVDFILDTGGSITGKVQTASSGPVADAYIEIYSQSQSGISLYGGVSLTDADGNYVVHGLKKEDTNGNPVSDYIVTVFTNDYPPQSAAGKKVGDIVNFTLGTTSELSGTVKNPLNQPFPDETIIKLAFYEATDTNGTITYNYTRIVELPVDASGNFTISGLSENKGYQLKFTAFAESELEQWAGTNGTGIITLPADGSAPPGTEVFYPGNIDFTFSTSIGRSAVSYDEAVSDESAPGPVQNLRSTSHISIDFQNAGIKRTGQNLSTSPSFKISNSPNITVTWDPSAGSEDESYYHVFNTETEHEITKRNAPGTNPVKTRKTTSRNLAGDDVTYYFHVAGVNDRGRIGDTSSLSFRIDTVAPKNVQVNVNNRNARSGDNSVVLDLGATGAVEMYISNTNYGADGKWENFSSTKQWKVSDGARAAKIYVQFRDEAGNISNALATVNLDSAGSDLANAIKVLQVLTGITVDTSSLTPVNDTQIGLQDAVMYLKNAAD
ncbi:carboxypeptidase-like regulatory domain-containing protein, partial [Desulfobacterales bacterium HSG17]|nr:carboxypeptidase-like regulatory domain-containing protein [Desulfobacterales bacterium HSG17]